MGNNNVLTRKKKEKSARAQKQGNHVEATRLLIQLSKATPQDPDVWSMLASSHGQQGNFQAVIDCCQRALTIQPSHPDANSLLGNALALQGHHDKALSCYRKALEVRPRDPGILNNLGNALYLAGELDEAAEKLKAVVAIKPEFPDAHNNLGSIYKALNRDIEAVHHFKRALALKPGLFEAWLNLGNIYSDRIGFPEAAEDCFRKAQALKPDNIEAESGLVNMLRFQGKLDEALTLLRSVIQRRPGDTTALAGEADLLERQGNHAAAYERVRKLVDSNHQDPMAVALMIRLCQQYDCCEEAISLGEKVIATGNLNNHGQRMLHFALGKLQDKLGHYHRAFMHYRQGNEVAGVPFETSKYEECFDDLIKTFNHIAMAQLPRARHGDTRPVFIVGMPRSGTSLTEQILASHPNVHGAGELNDLNDIAGGLPIALNSRLTYPECITELNQKSVDSLARRYLDRLDSFSRTALRITDKMPHNFVNLGLIALLFPDARIIHCQRDPRDTCLSIYFQDFGGVHPYATGLSNLGSYYRLYRQLMQHWESVIELPIMTARYEDLVTEQEQTSRKLVDFIGLDWDDNCLQFHKSKRTVATASYDQVRQPMYTQSMARWKHYEKHIGPLVEALGDVIND